MGMIDEGVKHMVSKLTLEEIESIAERLGAATKTIRDAQALLGGGGGSRAPDAVVSAATTIGPLPPRERGATVASLLTPAEQAEKARLMKLNFGPDDIDAMERA